MIIDSLKNYSTYIFINRYFEKAFEFIKNNSFNFPLPGDYEIEGRSLYSLVRVIETKPKTAGNWESHIDYIDIHYVFAGEEYIGYANIENMSINEYLNDKDKYVLNGDGDLIKISKSSFAIFFPQDAHMPGIRSGNNEIVKKIIIKVKI
jgi:YhcH/YjgK/YiaL family protein